MYETIRRAAYQSVPHTAPNRIPWTADYRALSFPEHWRAELLALHNLGRNSPDQHRTVPTRRLDGVLQTLAPELIVRPRPHTPLGQDAPVEEDFWLYAPRDSAHPLPDSAMRGLLAAWLRTLGPKGVEEHPEHRSLLIRTAAALQDDLPVWQDVSEVDLLGTSLSKGSTAVPSPRQFQLATDALARRIMTLTPYPFEGGELRFRAVPRGPRQQGAELMSQPLCRRIKRKDWWFSIILNISLHTVPFDPLPRLHLHSGVRRWATHPQERTGRLNLPFRQATSVYLTPTIPWLPGAPPSDRYAVARLTRRRDSEGNGIDWLHHDPAGILHRLSLNERFPSPEALLRAPVDWIGDGPGVRACVVHSNHMGAHEVGTGLMSNQRSEITSWAEEALPEGLVRLPDLVRRGRGVSAPANRRPKPRGEEAKQAESLRAAHSRRAALATVSALDARDGLPDHHTSGAGLPVVEARLLWQSPELRDRAIEAFCEVLGLDGDGGAPRNSEEDPDALERAFDSARPGSAFVLEWRTPELDLRLNCLPLTDGLGDSLAPDPEIKGKGARIAAAISSRRLAVLRHLKSDGAVPERPVLGLVEIAHRSTFFAAGTDPKFAMRLGCADAGVLTQFAVTPSNDWKIQNTDNLGHRVRNAWLDGLRQLGVRVLPEHTRGGDLPAELRYAALWMVKRRKDGPTRLPRHLPVAVLVTPLEGPDGLARVQGWDDDLGDWIPYPAFLLGLVKKAEIGADAYSEPVSAIPSPRNESSTAPAPPRVTSRQWRANMAEQRQVTSRFLQRMLHSLRGRPTVLITHAQNSRSHWPWLQDGQAVRDLVKLGHAPAERLDEDLRLVRVRGGAGRETAQWWGTDGPKGANGLPAGFWALPDSVEGRSHSDGRVFYSTTERAQSFPISPSLDRLAARVTEKGNLISQAGTGAWNPGLVEIAVLGCHPEPAGHEGADSPEALAMAMHQLRQAPDYPDALSLPLPLHLAGLAQAYVLPMLVEEEGDVPGGDVEATDDGGGDPDPDRAEDGSAVAESDPLEQLPLF
ncbi:pPIWI_RE module domain-containing protein [Streptomyces paludis]|uniref:DUF3893 domain-containing protein n=1 Tax=Streptomyces paludis TaxID=2282738 RepID=A0A345HX52_9ACTN|nr:DUF3962 domain-containing protein [Streptomyces paludis]AXG81276.1 DUF3893 domain-containing protein [Streptomyces paludis]